MTVFLPCRAGSERVPHKNTKLFCGIDGGLVKIKLQQLLNIKSIDSIVLSTNDNEVINIAKKISNTIIIDKRPEHLALSSTNTDELVNYVPKIIDSKHILWTHVTSPFLDAGYYEKAIENYYYNLESTDFDSLMSVNKLQNFIWNKTGSVNYDRQIEKWPRTQTLDILFEINSGIFINSRENYMHFKDRIGKRPFLFETEGYASFDIDWPDDFGMAELIYKHLNL